MTVRKNRHGRWMCDVQIEHADGRVERVRKVAPVQTRRDAESYERELRRAVLEGTRKEVTDDEHERAPTIAEYVQTFLREHAVARNLKPSTQISNEHLCRNWIVPVLGQRRLDEVRTGDFLRLREAMKERSTKTANNASVVLSALVKHWCVMNDRPLPTFRLGLVTADERRPEAYSVTHADALVEGAAKAGPYELAFVLIGLDAGLRQGEARALVWADLDLRSERPTVTVQRTREGRQPKRTKVHRLVEIEAMTKFVEHSTKNRRVRVVRLTSRLAAALRALPRAVHDAHVFLNDGEPLTRSAARQLVRRSETRAGLPVTGRYHVERHTFVTAVLEAGANPHVAQRLAGHSDPRVTARYTHVREGEEDAAILAMERRAVSQRHPDGTPRRSRSKKATQATPVVRPTGGG